MARHYEEKPRARRHEGCDPITALQDLLEVHSLNMNPAQGDYYIDAFTGNLVMRMSEEPEASNRFDRPITELNIYELAKLGLEVKLSKTSTTT